MTLIFLQILDLFTLLKDIVFHIGTMVITATNVVDELLFGHLFWQFLSSVHVTGRIDEHIELI